ncbi:MAG: hypothetical protein HC922_08990, partial [Leptolyngbyaceae cyanobacterium SM2_3_12]|nr:hypothetical protein [Leptolyngbyaceae cyanobacterium SM2_3_12]
PVPLAPQAPDLVIPAPTLPAPPPAELTPAPTQGNTPADEPDQAQINRVPAPAVSSLPQPEQSTHLRTTKDTELLYTGALFAGR